nr:hypothetical protein Iba_chr05eCG13140 [Ipomoea batatas]
MEEYAWTQLHLHAPESDFHSVPVMQFTFSTTHRFVYGETGESSFLAFWGGQGAGLTSVVRPPQQSLPSQDACNRISSGYISFTRRRFAKASTQTWLVCLPIQIEL